MLRPLFVIAFAATTVPSLHSIRADMPPLPPRDYEVRSTNGRYVARMTVAPPKITVSSEQDGVEVQAWSMDAFYPDVFLSDDGQHLVGANNQFLPIDYSPEMVMVLFVEHGRVLREVTLRDLMPDLSKIVPTASHYSWGVVSGLDERGDFVAKTNDYRDLYFDVKTGRLLKTERRYHEWLRDFVEFHPRYHPLLSCILGLVVGVGFRSRILVAVIANVAVSIALLLFVLWAQESFASLGEDGTMGSYRWITGQTIILLGPSTLLTVVSSLLWRLARRLPVRA